MVIRHYLSDHRFEDLAATLSRRLLRLHFQPSLNGFDLQEVWKVLLRTHTATVLNQIENLMNSAFTRFRVQQVLQESRTGVLDLDTCPMLDWAKKKPETRFELLTAIFPAYQKDKESGKIRLSEALLDILRLAPDPARTLVTAMDDYWIRGATSGSRALILENRRAAVKTLEDHQSTDIRDALPGILEGFDAAIFAEQKREEDRERERTERFE